MRRPRSHGQATIELALCLPLVALVMGAMVEAGLVATDQVRVWHAAREAARVAAVTGETEEIVAAAAGSDLHPISVVVQPDAAGRSQGGIVTTSVHMRRPVRVPLVGELWDVMLEASATMRIETP